MTEEVKDYTEHSSPDLKTKMMLKVGPSKKRSRKHANYMEYYNQKSLKLVKHGFPAISTERSMMDHYGRQNRANRSNRVKLLKQLQVRKKRVLNHKAKVFFNPIPTKRIFQSGKVDTSEYLSVVYKLAMRNTK